MNNDAREIRLPDGAADMHDASSDRNQGFTGHGTDAQAFTETAVAPVPAAQRRPPIPPRQAPPRHVPQRPAPPRQELQRPVSPPSMSPPSISPPSMSKPPMSPPPSPRQSMPLRTPPPRAAVPPAAAPRPPTQQAPSIPYAAAAPAPIHAIPPAEAALPSKPSPPWQVIVLGVFKVLSGIVTVVACAIGIVAILGSTTYEWQQNLNIDDPDTAMIIAWCVIGALAVWSVFGVLRIVAAICYFIGRSWSRSYFIFTFVAGTLLWLVAIALEFVAFGFLFVSADGDFAAASTTGALAIYVAIIIAIIAIHAYLLFNRRSRDYVTACRAHRLQEQMRYAQPY